ncbi:hypothetical protein CBR_g30100 [Chara braunii]|uniref:Uncharacterized protein n=1 Tax=Chara braunii TaxID=69332 RepID=A0A388LBY3_CHABU|nr:hypothetical protein CBR_g30100 [Chara braunii]|eukprot:GBG79835.1 hypothetical protein CBR_g30100 [Chara braunii]
MVEDEAKKEAEKEARLAKMMDERLGVMDKKREEENKKIWERIEKGKEKEPGKPEGEKVTAAIDNKKRGQDEMAGAASSQPSTPRQRVKEVGALDAGLLLMNIDSVQRAQTQQNKLIESQQAQQNAMFEPMLGMIEKIEASHRLGFDRVKEGTKAVVADPGPGGRRRYQEEMGKELMSKYKQELVDLCKRDGIKYHNKKQAVADLTAIRVRDAYGDVEEDEQVEETAEESQEENPS